MGGYRTRYADRAHFVADETSAVAYRSFSSCGNGDACGPDDSAATTRQAVEEQFAAQKNAIRVFCRAHCLHVWRTFSDRPGRAGRAACARMELARMLVEMRRKNIRTVIVYQGNRLSPDPLTRAHLLVYLRSRGVTVIEAIAGQELTAAAGLDHVAHGAGRERLARCKKAVTELKRLVTRISTGFTPGRRPFGSRPGEAETVKRMIELSRKAPRDLRTGGGRRRGSRPSFQAVADELNAEGRRTRSGFLWTGAAVRNVIRRERPRWMAG